MCKSQGGNSRWNTHRYYPVHEHNFTLYKATCSYTTLSDSHTIGNIIVSILKVETQVQREQMACSVTEPELKLWQKHKFKSFAPSWVSFLQGHLRGLKSLRSHTKVLSCRKPPLMTAYSKVLQPHPHPQG